MCSVHPNQLRAHSYCHSSSASSTCTLTVLLFSTEIPLLVFSPSCYETHHLLIERSSVFRVNVLVAFFYCNSKMLACWDPPPLSQLANTCWTSNTATDSSDQTSSIRLLSPMMVGCGKTTIIEDGSKIPTPWLLQSLTQVDFELAPSNG